VTFAPELDVIVACSVDTEGDGDSNLEQDSAMTENSNYNSQDPCLGTSRSDAPVDVLPVSTAGTLESSARARPAGSSPALFDREEKGNLVESDHNSDVAPLNDDAVCLGSAAPGQGVFEVSSLDVVLAELGSESHSCTRFDSCGTSLACSTPNVVSIIKEGDEKLGIVIEAHDAGLKVQTISDGGLVDKWNSEHETPNATRGPHRSSKWYHRNQYSVA
jgi:hypothetical protein